MAVGPDHVVAVVNARFRIWDKTGNVLKTIQARQWFASTLPGWQGLIFDPKIKYDHFANRWIILFLTDNGDSVSPGDISYYLISVSDDQNPVGTWYNWAVPASTLGDSALVQWTDYPGLGFDDQAIYIQSNQAFGLVGLLYAKVRIFDKAQLYANTAGPVSWTDFWDLRDPDNRGTQVFNVQPAVSFGSPGVGLLVSASPYNPGTFFTLWRIASPLTSPTISALNIPVVQYRPAPNAGQLGGGTSIDHGDGYLLPNEPVYRDSSLWVTHPIASGTGNAYASLRYIRLNPFTNTIREDIAFGREGYWYFFPAIMVDQDKNLVLTFSRSSTTEYVGAYVSGRRDTDPLGLSPSVPLKYGDANYVRLDPSGRNRWGDFMGIALDPSDGNAVWAFTEYAASPANTWGTWVGKVKIGPIPGAFVYLDRSSINYAKFEVGTNSDTVMVSMTNNGLDTLRVSNIALSTSNFELLNPPGLPLRLATLQTVIFGVTFTPHSPGNLLDSIMISSNDTLSPHAKIVLSGTGVLIRQAQAGVMYAASSGSPSGQFFRINVATGTTTPIAPLDINEIDGLAIRPTTKELYGTIATPNGTTICRVSSLYGSTLAVRLIPIPNMRAIAFSRGDTLFGATTSGTIYRISLATGSADSIGTTAGVVYSSLSFSPTSGMLWASVRPNLIGKDRIYNVNTSTGVATLIGSCGGGITPAIAFNAMGVLYGLKGTGTQIDTLISIDTLNASGTRIGSTGVSGLLALAMRTDSIGPNDVWQVDGTLPDAFLMYQNFPNPWNPSTTLRYSLPHASFVTLTVFNTLGQQVSQLVNEQQQAVYHDVVFRGDGLASGVYLYRLRAGDFIATRKLLFLK
ncbi:MAG TPA: hypothetical protein DGH68_10835 [Bacteroidetes bacterium]|nr:hypothetical protein [Bacteroidota bacterium]